MEHRQLFSFRYIIVIAGSENASLFTIRKGFKKCQITSRTANKKSQSTSIFNHFETLEIPLETFRSISLSVSLDIFHFEVFSWQIEKRKVEVQ